MDPLSMTLAVNVLLWTDVIDVVDYDSCYVLFDIACRPLNDFIHALWPVTIGHDLVNH